MVTPSLSSRTPSLPSKASSSPLTSSHWTLFLPSSQTLSGTTQDWASTDLHSCPKKRGFQLFPEHCTWHYRRDTVCQIALRTWTPVGSYSPPMLEEVSTHTWGIWTRIESLLMQTADSCFGLFGPRQCGVASGVYPQLLADQQLQLLFDYTRQASRDLVFKMLMDFVLASKLYMWGHSYRQCWGGQLLMIVHTVR